MSSRLNFLCLSADPQVQQRCQEIAVEFEYSYLATANDSELLELQDKYDQVQFILVDVMSAKEENEMAGLVQIGRQMFKDSFICVIAEKRLPAKAATFIKKSGANMVLFANELFETSCLEFVASQTIRASYVPVKLSEFPQDSVLDFTLYHLMPLNQKLLPILPKGSGLSEGRLKKLEGISEVYVKREEVDRYRNYVESHPDVTATGLKSRCRAQYLSFCNSHTQLVFLLLDQSESASFKEGKWLYDRCEILAKDFLATLSAVGEAWEIVNNASLGEFGSVERSPTISAYAGLISLLATIGEPVQVMISGLLADVGMLDLSPKITKKLRHAQNLEALSPEELDEYKKHPLFSVNRCLARKLQLSDSIREMILCSHERVDMKGFPKGRPSDEIPMEAMLIQFSEKIDSEAMVKLGQARTSVQEVRKRTVETEQKDPKIFSFTFLQKLKPVI